MPSPILSRLLLPLLLTLTGENGTTTSAYTVAVFGGSGFIGSRVCRTLVQSGADVVSVSREGGPPEWAQGQAWTDGVDWLAADVGGSAEGDGDEVLRRALGRKIDGAVSCVGAIEPAGEFDSFFGLRFDSDRLREDISSVNERIVDLSKNAGAKRFAFLSVSYETQKALEGAIEGYIDGKRSIETSSHLAFGPRATAISPSLVYGGKRFPTLGKIYRTLVAGPGRAYVAGNDALRNISPAPMEDWVEKMIFSEPVEVEVVARAVAVGVLMGGELLGEGGCLEPRRQGFYSNEGEAITLVDIPVVDGTAEIERIARERGTDEGLVEAIRRRKDEVEVAVDTGGADEDSDVACTTAREALRTTKRRVKEEAFEGALVGKKPYLYPIPVLLTFVFIFWGIATDQWTQVQVTDIPIV